MGNERLRQNSLEHLFGEKKEFFVSDSGALCLKDFDLRFLFLHEIDNLKTFCRLLE